MLQLIAQSIAKIGHGLGIGLVGCGFYCGAIEDESTKTQDLYGLGGASRSWGNTDGAVVPRSAWPATVLTDGDRVEVLTATQGG